MSHAQIFREHDQAGKFSPQMSMEYLTAIFAAPPAPSHRIKYDFTVRFTPGCLSRLLADFKRGQMWGFPKGGTIRRRDGQYEFEVTDNAQLAILKACPEYGSILVKVGDDDDDAHRSYLAKVAGATREYDRYHFIRDVGILYPSTHVYEPMTHLDVVRCIPIDLLKPEERDLLVANGGLSQAHGSELATLISEGDAEAVKAMDFPTKESIHEAMVLACRSKSATCLRVLLRKGERPALTLYDDALSNADFSCCLALCPYARPTHEQVYEMARTFEKKNFVRLMEVAFVDAAKKFA